MPLSLTESPTFKEPISYAVPSEAFNDSNSDLNLSRLADAAEMHPEVGADAPEIDLPIPDVLSLLTSLGNGNFILTEEEPVQSSSWNKEVESIFYIPTSSAKNTKSGTTNRSITSHRVLTSEEVIASKQEKLAEKERKDKLREERRMKKMKNST